MSDQYKCKSDRTKDRKKETKKQINMYCIKKLKTDESDSLSAFYVFSKSTRSFCMNTRKSFKSAYMVEFLSVRIAEC